MGTIAQVERDLTAEELLSLKRLHEAQDASPAGEVSLAALRALEFDICVDGIAQPQCVGLPESMQLYVLNVAPSVEIGFEPCFMENATVDGVFPTHRVRVAFAVRPLPNGEWEEVAPGHWPISFQWCGQAATIIDAPEFPTGRPLYAIYNLGDLLNAVQAVAPASLP